jgi:CO/xanthine dehydrogenase Mo-binding subunit
MALHRGRGFAAINYPIGMNLRQVILRQALIHSNPDGKFTVALSAIDLGQGMESVTRQIAGRDLGRAGCRMFMWTRQIAIRARMIWAVSRAAAPASAWAMR